MRSIASVGRWLSDSSASTHSVVNASTYVMTRRRPRVPVLFTQLSNTLLGEVARSSFSALQAHVRQLTDQARQYRAIRRQKRAQRLARLWSPFDRRTPLAGVRTPDREVIQTLAKALEALAAHWGPVFSAKTI